MKRRLSDPKKGTRAEQARDARSTGRGRNPDVAPAEPEDEAADRRSGATAVVPYDPLQRYLTEIRRYPVLSREEEHELGVRYREYGDIEAAYQLVTSNLRLVVLVAREYQRAFHTLLDLIQEGNVGLMEAVKKFDPYRGVRFPSYAVWWVRAYIIRFIMNNWRMVKIGTTQAQRKLFFNLQKEKDRLEAEGFIPSPALIARRVGVKKSEVVEMEQRLAARDLSVDAPLDADAETTLLDLLTSEDETVEDRVAEAQYRRRLQQKIAEFGAALKNKEAVIFRHRLLAEEPLTLQEIGDRYGISRERVRQIESRVKKRLKLSLLAEFKDLADLDVSFV